MSKTATIHSNLPGSDRAAFLMRAENNVNVYAPHSVSIDPAALFSALAGLGFPDDGWTECDGDAFSDAILNGRAHRQVFASEGGKDVTHYFIRLTEDAAAAETPRPARCRCHIKTPKEPTMEDTTVYIPSRPRPITANEIRKGDRIRVTWLDAETTGTAFVRLPHGWVTEQGRNLSSGPGETIELLHRPAPQLPTEPGATIWAREVRGIRYEGDGKGWPLLLRLGLWESVGHIAGCYSHRASDIGADWEPAVVS